MEQMPRLQADKSCNFDEFTDVVMRLLNAAWGPQWGTFSEAFPNGRDSDNVTMPVITYLLKEMVPGVIGKGGVREIKPRRRDIVLDNGMAMEIYGRVFDCIVVFEIWEENNSKATKLATQFMEFIDMYTGYIKSQGVKEIILQRMDNNTVSGEWRDNIVCRKLEYYVRLEHLSEVQSDVISKVTASISPVENLSVDSIKESITFSQGVKL